MKRNLYEICEKTDIVNRAKKNAESYILNWYEDFYDEFKEYIFPYSIEKDLKMDCLKRNFEVIKVAYEICLVQENIERLAVTIDVKSNTGEQIFTYYSFYDMEGRLVDNFIDK